MESTPRQPDDQAQSAPRNRAARKRAQVIEFEFAKEVIVTPPEKIAEEETVKESSSNSTVLPQSAVLGNPQDTISDSLPQPLEKPFNPIQRRPDMPNPPIKPSTISDFKRNIDQQKREQSSFSNVLATITYLVLIGLILVTGLAGYGARVFWLRMNQQANTLDELDRKYEAAVTDLNEDLKRSRAEIDRVNGQLSRQQEQISVLRSSLDKALNDERTDHASSVREIASLQKQITDLESKSNVGRF